MKVKLIGFSSIFAFVCMTLFNITISITSATATTKATVPAETKDFVDKIKTHYQQTLSIKAFSLGHHYLNKQSRDHHYWDYQTPNRIMSQRLVEVDLAKKHFYDNDVHYSSGGLLNDYVQFQNDKDRRFNLNLRSFRLFLQHQRLARWKIRSAASNFSGAATCYV